MIDLHGKIALVTGGSRGIGRAIAIMMAEAGADVAFSYRSDHSAAENTICEIKRKGREVFSQACDMTDGKACERFFDESSRRLGKVDIVVANAGIWHRAPIDEMTLDQWRETAANNLDSAFFISQLAARHFKAKKSGNLILISSTAGIRGEAFHAHYAASKGAIIALTRSLAAELSYHGINVNCVAPGWVDTDMTKHVFGDPTYRQTIEQSIPLRRIASPRDIAGVVVFLASSLARHIQGEVVNVNGGSLIR